MSAEAATDYPKLLAAIEARLHDMKERAEDVTSWTARVDDVPALVGWALEMVAKWRDFDAVAAIGPDTGSEIKSLARMLERAS